MTPRLSGPLVAALLVLLSVALIALGTCVGSLGWEPVSLDLAEVRLMMVTTENERERVVEALEAGADEFLMKPFTVLLQRDR